MACGGWVPPGRGAACHCPTGAARCNWLEAAGAASTERRSWQWPVGGPCVPYHLPQVPAGLGLLSPPLYSEGQQEGTLVLSSTLTPLYTPVGTRLSRPPLPSQLTPPAPISPATCHLAGTHT